MKGKMTSTSCIGRGRVESYKGKARNVLRGVESEREGAASSGGRRREGYKERNLTSTALG